MWGVERWRSAGGFLVLAVLFTTAACAHVNRDELASELEQVREEMREGDEAVERRLSEEIRSLEDRMEHRLASLEMELGELRDEFQVTVERFETAIRFNAPVHFAFDDASVRDEDREVLDRFAALVREYYGDAVITVEGFTDPAGDPQYNIQLGERRAEAVKEELVRSGLSLERMRAVSYGEAPERQIVPGASGPGEDGWQNRRVAMVIDFGPSEGLPVVTVAPH